MSKTDYYGNTTSEAFNKWKRTCNSFVDVMTYTVGVLFLVQSLSWLWEVTLQIGFYNNNWRSEVRATCKSLQGCAEIEFERHFWSESPDRHFFCVIGAHTSITVLVVPGYESSVSTALSSIRGFENSRHVLTFYKRVKGVK